MAELFARWTPAERWLAGLLWADGYISPANGRSWAAVRARCEERLRQRPYTSAAELLEMQASGGRVVLNSVDDDLIGQAAEVIGPDHRRYPPQSPRTPAQRPLHRLQFTDELGALAELGFGPKPGRWWPDDLASAEFLRGLFDGDGHVSWRRVHGASTWGLRAVLTSPKAVLDGARRWLAAQGMSWRNINPQGNSWRLQWGHADSLRLAEIMYAKPGPHLARKRARFLSPGAP